MSLDHNLFGDHDSESFLMSLNQRAPGAVRPELVARNVKAHICVFLRADGRIVRTLLGSTHLQFLLEVFTHTHDIGEQFWKRSLRTLS